MIFFFIVKYVNFACYADDNTIYQSGRNVDDVINDLQLSAENLFPWFSDNQMKGNTDKCHLIMSTNLLKLVLIKMLKLIAN